MSNSITPEQHRMVEDAVINDFIRDELPIWDVKGDPQLFEELKPRERKIAEATAFKYFNSLFESKQRENKKYSSLSFENFLKISRPEKELVNSDNLDSKLYKTVFGSDTGSFKQAAISGMKRIIAENV